MTAAVFTLTSLLSTPSPPLAYATRHLALTFLHPAALLKRRKHHNAISAGDQRIPMAIQTTWRWHSDAWNLIRDTADSRAIRLKARRSLSLPMPLSHRRHLEEPGMNLFSSPPSQHVMISIGIHVYLLCTTATAQRSTTLRRRWTLIRVGSQRVKINDSSFKAPQVMDPTFTTLRKDQPFSLLQSNFRDTQPRRIPRSQKTGKDMIKLLVGEMQGGPHERDTKETNSFNIHGCTLSPK